MGNTRAVRAANFTASIAVNTHMNYTDGAYANVANVKSDLAYLGISLIRDSMPNPDGGIPYYNQVAALETLAQAGVRFDLGVEPSSTAIAVAEQQIEMLDSSTANSVFAVEGPNEINNYPVAYDGLTGQPAATAFQIALYQAISGAKATSAIKVYNFTGGLQTPMLAGGTVTRNTNGSYTLTNGDLGFRVTLPEGVSTIKMTYTGSAKTNPASALFGYPGQNQQTSLVYSKTGTIAYTYDNTSGGPKTLYADFLDGGDTYTLTGVDITGPGSSTNLITFDPNLSLAGQANDANVHIYPLKGGAIGPNIAGAYQAAYFNQAPGYRVITETGYDTDPNDPNGVTQTVQAQQIINGLLDAYKSGVSTTYIYELLDEKSDPDNTNPEMHFGLFNFNNTPKLAAVALHNLTSLLADTGATAKTFTTGSLDYAIKGSNGDDHSMLFQKSSGEFDVAIWNDSFAGTSSTDNVTLSLGATFHTVSIHNLLTGAETSLSNVSQVSVTLGGDPMLVEISQAAVASAPAMGFLPGAAFTDDGQVSDWAPMMALPQTGGAISPFAAIMTQAHPGLVAAALAQPPVGVATSLVVHASKPL